MKTLPSAIAQPHAAMDVLLEQLRSTAKMAGVSDVLNPSAANVAPATHAASFSGIFKQALDKVAALQNTASSSSRAFTLGEPGVSLNDVMIDTQKAGLALQATVQVRNRIVAAYQEIANMAV